MTFPGTSLPARFELDLAGTGAFSTNITTDVRTATEVQITRGRAEESSSPEPSTCSLVINNRSGNYSPRNAVGAYYGTLGRNTPIRVSIDSDTSWLRIDEATGNTVGTAYATTPDAAALDIVGDIDLRFDADFDTWRSFSELITKWDTAGNQRSYAWLLRDDGRMTMYYSTAGTVLAVGGTSSTKVPVTTGRLAVRVTVDVNDGAGNRVLTYYTAPTMAGPWTQLGDVLTFSGVASFFSGTSPLRLLDNPLSTDIVGDSIRGRVFAAQVRSGINGTVVANPDFQIAASGASSFVDSAGLTWTPTGNVAISNRDVKFIGEVSQWPVKWNQKGTDVYSPIEAAGVFRRLTQGTSALKSVLYRAITSLATPAVQYWPCEDAGSSTTIASALPGALPMHFKGGVSFGSDDTFAASSPLLTTGDGSIYGFVPTYTSTQHQVRFLINIPVDNSIADDSNIFRVDCAGTATRWEVNFRTGGGISLRAFDTASPPNTLLDVGIFVYNLVGNPLRFHFGLTQSGGNVNWEMYTARIDVALGGNTGTLTGQTVTRITKVTMAATAKCDATFGHIVVQKAIGSNAELLDQMQAYDGEVAGRRIERLCAEEDVAFQGLGDLDDSVVMGPQRAGQLLDLLNECAVADFGMLAESKLFLGILYRPRSSFQNSLPSLTMPYASLANLDPIEDDSATVNDVTAVRTKGSSARVTQDTGRLSTQVPPNGIGRYDTSITVNVSNDGQLPDEASWRLHLGTWDEPRYPTIDLNAAHPTIAGVPAQAAAVNALDLGDQLVITGSPSARTGPGDISQLVQGITEVISQRGHRISARCSPERAWRVGTYASGVAPSASKYDSDGSTLGGAGATTTSTSWSIVTPSGPLWTTSAAEYPFDFMVAGEQVTVTAMSGASSPQTATVTRSVNGVVKTHVAGETIAFANPAYYSL
jgi:hypothetical protein